MSEAEDNDILELDSETEDVEMNLMEDVGEFQYLYLFFAVFITCSFTRL